MNHIHHKSITSTQDDLINLHSPISEGTLISTDLQTNGKGQHGREWSHFNGAIAMSFGLRPNTNITMTSLEVPALVSQFFKENYGKKIFLKWPNDLLNEKGEKIGGILINRHGNEDFAVGLGMNLRPFSSDEEFRFPAGNLFEGDFEFDCEKLALKIYQYILAHRLNEDDVILWWEDHCIHQGREVKIVDGDKVVEGFFLGLGKHGQALVSKRGETLVHECFTGSLFF